MKQKHIIKFLQEKHPDCRIAYHASPRGRWVHTTIKNMEDLAYNHRGVLLNEVVIDLDAETKEENFEALKKIVSRLAILKVKNSVWETGGKGFHVHTFWKRLDTVKEPKLMKDLLLDWLVWRTDAKIDKQLNGNHLVRMEYGYYEKTYPADAQKLPVNDKDHFVENEIPAQLWSSYETEVLSWALRRLNPGKKKPFKGMPLCMRYIMSQDFKAHKDGTKRSLFVIASYHRRMDDDKLIELLREYNNYYSTTPYTQRQLKAIINSVRKNKGRPVGCRYRHELLREVGAEEAALMCEQQKTGLNNDVKGTTDRGIRDGS